MSKPLTGFTPGAMAARPRRRSSTPGAREAIDFYAWLAASRLSMGEQRSLIEERQSAVVRCRDWRNEYAAIKRANAILDQFGLEFPDDDTLYVRKQKIELFVDAIKRLIFPAWHWLGRSSANSLKLCKGVRGGKAKLGGDGHGQPLQGHLGVVGGARDIGGLVQNLPDFLYGGSGLFERRDFFHFHCSSVGCDDAIGTCPAESVKAALGGATFYGAGWRP